MSSSWCLISFKFANPYFMRFNFHDVYFPIHPIVRKKNAFCVQ